MDNEWWDMSDMAWLDHVMDLEHNGGSVFDKRSAASVVDVAIGYVDNWRLDRKARVDLTQKTEVINLMENLTMSISLYKLISRCIGEYLPNRVYVPHWDGVSHGHSVIDIESQYHMQCECCGDGITEDDMVCINDYGYICSYCWHHDNSFQQCSETGERCHVDYMVRVEGKYYQDGHEPVHCTCWDCDKNFSPESVIEIDGECYCEDCVPNYETCYACEENHETDDMENVDGYWFCEDCAKGLEKCQHCGEHMYEEVAHENPVFGEFMICEECDKKLETAPMLGESEVA